MSNLPCIVGFSGLSLRILIPKVAPLSSITCQCFVDDVVDFGSDILVQQLIVFGSGIYSIGEKYIDQLIIWIRPHASACEASVAEGALWS